MRKNALILPASVLIAGAAGLFLRRSELATVFDEKTGLPTRGAAVTTALVTLVCVIVLMCLAAAILIRARYRSPAGFENAFGPLGVIYALSIAALGFVWMLAAAYGLFVAASAQPAATSEIYLTSLSVLAALSVIMLYIWLYKEPKKNAKLLFCVIPPLFLCLWLVILYRDNSANPVLLSYCYESLAIITSAMAFYFTAGFIYGRPAPGRSAFAYLTGAFFCGVVQADNLPYRERIIFAVMLAIHLVSAARMIARLERKTKAAIAGETDGTEEADSEDE